MNQKLSEDLTEARRKLSRSIANCEDINVKLDYLTYDFILMNFLDFVNKGVDDMSTEILRLRKKLQ